MPSFSLEILLQIMHGCSPLELLQMQLSCRRFYQTLKYHPRSWQASRRQMEPPIPDPPSVTSSGNWSEAAYATLIFGTGLCAICGVETSTMPCSFALRFRFCSTSCRQRSHRTAHLIPLPGRKTAKFNGHAHRADFRHWMPYSEGCSPALYRSSFVKTAEDQYFAARAVDRGRNTALTLAVPVKRNIVQLKQAWELRKQDLSRIMQNAEALKSWAKEYKQRMETVKKANIDFIRGISDKERVKYRVLFQSPTMEKVLTAFVRGLEEFDDTFWFYIRGTVLEECRVIMKKPKKSL
ncbi:hypothetical protein C8R44DRAFT_808676 [Mycena epipterygia]|nr:hypothetical protein C8R44DRAFT_808676 [Mycena epipterygia]